jgi:drug/metabolite transporter (DMT)-like permease
MTMPRANRPAQQQVARQSIGILAGLGAGALWGVVFVAPRLLPGYTALEITSGRYAAYGLVALLTGWWMRRSLARLRSGDWWAAAGLSLIGNTGYYFLLSAAIQRAGTEVPTLVIGTIPVWVMLLGKPAGLRWSALGPGLLLTLAGLALMLWAPVHQAAAGDVPASSYWFGVTLAVLSLASWTLFAVLNARWLKRHAHLEPAAWNNALGLATALGALAAHAAASGFMPAAATNDEARPMLAFVAVCLFTGLGSSWLAGWWWNVASQRLPTSLSGQLIVSETVFALLYSFAWDGAWPSATQALAAACFVGGILLSIRAHR